MDLPTQAAYDPYTPRVNLDSKAVAATQAFAAVLREHLSHLFNQPVEARLQKLRPGLWSISLFVLAFITKHTIVCFLSDRLRVVSDWCVWYVL